MPTQLSIFPEERLDPKLKLPRVEIFTDGACEPNPGYGGWACIVRSIDFGFDKEMSGGAYPTTNNRMEMIACIRALKWVGDKACDITIYTDSMVLIHTINGMGRRFSKRKNQDLVAELWELLSKHKVTATWIKGHNGHIENERCDELAMQQVIKGRAIA